MKNAIVMVALLGSIVLAAPQPARALVDNLDGTITDQATGLVWEKKTGTIDVFDPGDPHDVNNTYAWCLPDGAICATPGSPPDGAAFTDFLARLNGLVGPDPCFAGFCDWRLPTLEELLTILDAETPDCGEPDVKCIDPLFGPTAFRYWAADSPEGVETTAWSVDFEGGEVNDRAKASSLWVRAVRGTFVPPPTPTPSPTPPPPTPTPEPADLVDNGDGTVIDRTTDLQWEKKAEPASLHVPPVNLPDPHDKLNSYTWCAGTPYLPGSGFGGVDPACNDPQNPPDGSVFTQFLPSLNGSNPPGPCFAGFCDWRLPTRTELESILNPAVPGCSGISAPCIDPLFGPTDTGNYWTSTTATRSSEAWRVLFASGGNVGSDEKPYPLRARAVRSGTCGDRWRASYEQCDDGGTATGDGCDTLCFNEQHLPPTQVAAGASISTESLTGPVSAAVPVSTAIASPVAGTVEITQTSPATATPSGFRFLDREIRIVAPQASAAEPLLLTFTLDASVVPAGESAGSIDVVRTENGVTQILADCAAGTTAADPDPCVASRDDLPGGDVRFVVRTSAASEWNFATAGCTAAPLAGCRTPFVAGKSQLLIRDGVEDEKDFLQWKWVRGAATALGDFGTPLLANTSASMLCVYDDAHPGGARIAAKIAAGGACGARPCWKAAKNAFRYANPPGNPAGIFAVLLKAGADGKAAVQVGAKGVALPLPAASLGASVTVQLQARSGACWSSELATKVTRKDSSRWR